MDSWTLGPMDWLGCWTKSNSPCIHQSASPQSDGHIRTEWHPAAKNIRMVRLLAKGKVAGSPALAHQPRLMRRARESHLPL